MNPDQLINHALSNATPGMAEGAFIVEANAVRKETRILPADEAMKMNLTAFARGLQTGFSCGGIFQVLLRRKNL